MGCHSNQMYSHCLPLSGWHVNSLIQEAHSYYAPHTSWPTSQIDDTIQQTDERVATRRRSNTGAIFDLQLPHISPAGNGCTRHPTSYHPHKHLHGRHSDQAVNNNHRICQHRQCYPGYIIWPQLKWDVEKRI